MIVIHEEVWGRVIDLVVVNGWNDKVRDFVKELLLNLKDSDVIKWFVSNGRGFRAMAQDRWDVHEAWMEVKKGLGLRRRGHLLVMDF